MCLCEIKWDDGKGLEILSNQVIKPMQFANQVLSENNFNYDLDEDRDKVLLHLHYHFDERLGEIAKTLGRFMDELKV